MLLGRDDRKYSLFLSVAQTVLPSKHTQQTKAKFDFWPLGESFHHDGICATDDVCHVNERTIQRFCFNVKNAKCRKQEDVQ